MACKRAEKQKRLWQLILIHYQIIFDEIIIKQNSVLWKRIWVERIISRA